MRRYSSKSSSSAQEGEYHHAHGNFHGDLYLREKEEGEGEAEQQKGRGTQTFSGSKGFAETWQALFGSVSQRRRALLQRFFRVPACT